MSTEAFRAALDELGWTYAEAAEHLGVSSPGRIGDWANGRRSVPLYIGVSVRLHLERHREGLRAG